MPKATETPTTPATRAPACTASQDAVLRMLAPSFISSEDWNSRTPTGKAMQAVRGTAERLEGLQNICFDLSVAEMAKRGPNANDAFASPYRFLAVTLGDHAKALSAAYKLWWDNVEAESKGEVA
jgi:hypothetical protein